MSQINTHVLDTSLGKPAAGINVFLEQGNGAELARGTTDPDGRISSLGPEQLTPGIYRLRFATENYLNEHSDGTGFFPEVTITFRVAAADQHYHVPLLLSPFGYSTYRGS